MKEESRRLEAQEENDALRYGLADALDALRGGERYLRTLALEIRKREGPSAAQRDSGARQTLSRDRAQNEIVVDGLASSLERQLGLTKGVLRAAVTTFRDRFASLVRSWLAFRPVAAKWAQKHPDAWEAVQRVTGETRLKAYALPSGLRLDIRFPDQAQASWENAESAATRLFIQFASNPLQIRLRLCARARCGVFFIAGRSDQKSCSARCATSQTAAKANRSRRSEERGVRITRLRTAIKKIGARKRLPPDWKERVARHAEVTPTFVTRALNRGEITVPRKKQARNTD
jgi:hypothetical protein